MRALASPAAAVLGTRFAMAQLVQLDLTSPIRLTTAGVDLVWSGNTFIGRKMVGSDSIKDQGGEVIGMQLSLSGVDPATLALALAEPVQGKRVRVWAAIMDADTHALLDVNLTWAGTLDQMPIQQGVATAVVGVTAEHRGIAFARTKPLRYTDQDQQALFPGDSCLQYIVAQSQHQDIWPAASFFRQ